MAPFPEAEDMTIKRLYVALKRDDMQLLQMGAHKLHEKYHTGHDFLLKDDLRQILSYVEEQAIPLDIKDLLTRTINKILNGEKPEIEEEYKEEEVLSEPEQTNPVEFLSEESESKVSNINALWGNTEIQQESTVTHEEKETTDETLTEKTPDEGFEPFEEESVVEEKIETTFEEQNDQFLQDESNKESFEEQKEEAVIFTPSAQTQETTNIQNEQATSQEETAKEPVEEDKYELKNVMVFYDDKASFTDYQTNKLYRNNLASIGLGEKDSLIGDIIQKTKNTADIPTEEIGEVLKMLGTIKNEVYFITSSKSENILKTFKDNNISFEIPLVKAEENQNVTTVIPLFGLSNIFYCPKCGKKECCLNFENKTLTLQCSNCNGTMYPDICESSNSETTSSNPYYWVKAIQYMANADTWILINPPLEANKALVAELLKTAFEVSKPKKVYILSRETTKREFFKQVFLEIEPNTDIKADYIMQDILCEEFINNEISPSRVNL